MKNMKTKTNKKEKRAVSPVIATILLVAIVIVLALIIFLWARGFVQERVQKFIGGEMKDADEVCGEIKFDAELSDDKTAIDIVNRGNVPIYAIDVKKIGGGASGREEYRDLNLDVGGSNEISDLDIDGIEEILIIPKILGQKGDQNQIYTCSEDNGKIIEVV